MTPKDILLSGGRPIGTPRRGGDERIKDVSGNRHPESLAQNSVVSPDYGEGNPSPAPRERVAAGLSPRTGEGPSLRQATLTLPALCAGPLPLPQCGRGV